MTPPRTGILLLNLGTPSAPETGPVRRYLAEFLNDPRVLDVPTLPRALLLYGAILPFRPRQSAHAYRKIWTTDGSPLLTAGRTLAEKLAARYERAVPVELAMRYQEPSIRGALTRFRSAGIERIVAVPLFPQYSSAATGSALEALYAEAGRLYNVPSLQIVPAFYEHPAFLEAVVSVARPVLATFRPDHLLMSFHGLPVRQVRKGDPTGTHCYGSERCCDSIGPQNAFCYRAQCHATARGIAAALELQPGAWELAFQSRLGRIPWIEPYTDVRVVALARSGVRRLAVICPAFVADCLETLEEIGIRARESFLAAGGEALELVPCVNASDVWVDALVRLLGETSPDLAR